MHELMQTVEKKGLFICTSTHLFDALNNVDVLNNGTPAQCPAKVIHALEHLLNPDNLHMRMLLLCVTTASK